jgi:hypothetical protein
MKLNIAETIRARNGVWRRVIENGVPGKMRASQLDLVFRFSSHAQGIGVAWRQPHAGHAMSIVDMKTRHRHRRVGS